MKNDDCLTLISRVMTRIHIMHVCSKIIMSCRIVWPLLLLMQMEQHQSTAIHLSTAISASVHTNNTNCLSFSKPINWLQMYQELLVFSHSVSFSLSIFSLPSLS